MDYNHSWRALLRPGDGNDFFSLRPLPKFDPYTTNFHAPNAWWLAEISRLIYRSEPGAELPGFPSRTAILSKLSIHEIAFSSDNNAQWSLNRVEGVRPFAVLVFRGSCGFENWLANLNIFQSLLKGGGQAHIGFKAIFMEIRDKIEAALHKVAAPVFYTGHSLGGALSVLAASIWSPQATYTFGAPRVGDMPFRESLSGQPIFRITNNMEIVTGVPPSRIPFEFCHVGQCFRIEFPENAALKGEPDGGLATAGTGQSPATETSSGLFSCPPLFLSGHAPINYCAGLEQCLRKLQAL